MYKAICKDACTFAGRFWRAGEEYRGRQKPPHHFKDVETVSDAVVVPNACPHCDKELPTSEEAVALKAEVDVVKKALAAAEAQIVDMAAVHESEVAKLKEQLNEPPPEVEDDPGLQGAQLSRMDWAGLFAVGADLGINFDAVSEQQGKKVTRQQMIDAIQAKEREIAFAGAEENHEGVN